MNGPRRIFSPTLAQGRPVNPAVEPNRSFAPRVSVQTRPLRSVEAPIMGDHVARPTMRTLSGPPQGMYYEYVHGRLCDRFKSREILWRNLSNTAGVAVALLSLTRFVLPQMGVDLIPLGQGFSDLKNIPPMNGIDVAIVGGVAVWLTLFNMFRAYRDVFSRTKNHDISEFDGWFRDRPVEHVGAKANEDGKPSETHYRDTLLDEKEITKRKENRAKQIAVLMAVGTALPALASAFLTWQAPLFLGTAALAFFAAVGGLKSLIFRSAHSTFESVDLERSLNS